MPITKSEYWVKLLKIEMPITERLLGDFLFTSVFSRNLKNSSTENSPTSYCGRNWPDMMITDPTWVYREEEEQS